MFIIIYLLVYIYCSFSTCISEEDTSKCQQHSIESPFMSCYPYEFSYQDWNSTFCSIYFADQNLQKLNYKINLGDRKEGYSMKVKRNSTFDFKKEVETETILFYEKDTYTKGETIKMKELPLKNYVTSKDITIIEKGNTCGNYMYQSGDQLIKSLDKKTCYGVDSFDEWKNVMDCAYATVSITYENQKYKYYSCIPDLDDKIEQNIKQIYYDENNEDSPLLFQLLTYNILNAFFKEVSQGQDLKVKNLKKRKLKSKDYDLTMTLEDRYGHIKTFDENGKLISESDDPTKISQTSHSNQYALNIVLIILNILLLL